MEVVIKMHEDKVKGLQDQLKQEQIDIVNIRKILKDKVRTANLLEGAIQMAQQSITVLKDEAKKVEAKSEVHE